MAMILSTSTLTSTLSSTLFSTLSYKIQDNVYLS